MKYLLYSPKGRCGSVSLSLMMLDALYQNKCTTHNYHASFEDGAMKMIEAVYKDEEKIRNHIITLERELVKIVDTRTDESGEASLVLEHSPYIFTKDQQDAVPDHTVIHSHGCFSASGDDWKNILVSRKNKLELTMSQLIAMKSGVWQNLEGDKIKKFKKDIEYLNTPDTDEPFVFPKYSYLESLKQLEAAESAFIKNARKNTGKDPIIIYLEDTLEEKSRKIGLDLAISQKIPGISVRRPKDYILNYDELKEVYDDFIENKEYHMSIPFKN
jgi:hypothetical protein